MIKVVRRYFLREKEKRVLLRRFSKASKIDAERLFGRKPRIEVIETLRHEILVIDGAPLLVISEEGLFPTLLFREALSLLPRITVDMGAVPHICNGADVMAPGVVGIHGDFKEGDLVVVVDEKHGKPLAIGRSLFGSESAKTLRQGRVFKNLHHIGDGIWNIMKNLS
jgi:PUA domain protein